MSFIMAIYSMWDMLCCTSVAGYWEKAATRHCGNSRNNWALDCKKNRPILLAVYLKSFCFLKMYENDISKIKAVGHFFT